MFKRLKSWEYTVTNVIALKITKLLIKNDGGRRKHTGKATVSAAGLISLGNVDAVVPIRVEAVVVVAPVIKVFL